ncbi:uncharacterized protein [Ptychodera flava]|uniref:uncharacterized protein isoform X2 n=1 Tax=Ptychodera flava TaxID=63121 RepID=UPI00396A4B12
MGCAPSTAEGVIVSKTTPQERAPTKEEYDTDNKPETLDFSLIEDNTSNIDDILSYLRRQEDYAGETILDEKLVRLSEGFYNPSDEKIFPVYANYLAVHGYPQLYVKIFNKLHSYDFLDRNTKKDTFALIGCYLATSVLWNTCDSSPVMCREVGKAGIIELMMGDLGALKEYAVVKERDEYKDAYLEGLLATLHNIIRLYIDNRGYFRNAGAVEILQYYLHMEKILYRTYALLTLSFIVNDDENHRINTGNENLEFLVTLLKSALESKDHREKEYLFHSTELVAGITKLAVNDQNKVKLVNAGVLKPLVKMLQDECTVKENLLAATAVWTLAFHKENKNNIQNEDGCVEALEKLQKSPDHGLRKACDGALWELKANKEKEVLPSTVTSKGHVMISYNWGVQKRMIRLKEKLKAAGFKVWMDIEKMGGSTLEAMAEAVQGADVVLICMSEKYKYSNPCRSEAEYTYKLNKDYIPIRVQSNYTPDGWLGIMVGAKLYFDFSTEDYFEKHFPNLVKELGERGKNTIQEEHSEVVRAEVVLTGTGNPSHNTSLNGPVSSWNNDDVNVWLKENELDHLTPKFKTYTGRKLLKLRKISLEAPQFFYKSMENKLGIKDLCDMATFKEALEDI